MHVRHLLLVAAAGACTQAPAVTTARPVPPVAASAPGSPAPSADTSHAHHAPAPAIARPEPLVTTDAQGRRFTAADVQFMQHMIHHHAQALTMTSLVGTRSTRSDIRALAERISVSQRDEIVSMRAWLTERGQEAPNPDPDPRHIGHGAPSHAGMAGMATPDQLVQLSAARGASFDRLFLELMIRHHEGAVTMVRRLFASPAAGQDSQLFSFASDVEADQDAEIARMRRLLAGSPTATPPR